MERQLSWAGRRAALTLAASSHAQLSSGSAQQSTIQPRRTRACGGRRHQSGRMQGPTCRRGARGHQEANEEDGSEHGWLVGVTIAWDYRRVCCGHGDNAREHTGRLCKRCLLVCAVSPSAARCATTGTGWRTARHNLAQAGQRAAQAGSRRDNSKDSSTVLPAWDADEALRVSCCVAVPAAHTPR